MHGLIIKEKFIAMESQTGKFWKICFSVVDVSQYALSKFDNRLKTTIPYPRKFQSWELVF